MLRKNFRAGLEQLVVKVKLYSLKCLKKENELNTVKFTVK